MSKLIKPSHVVFIFKAFLVLAYVVCLIDMVGLFWLLGPLTLLPWLLLSLCIWMPLLAFTTYRYISNLYLPGYLLAVTIDRYRGGGLFGREIWPYVLAWMLFLSGSGL